MKCLNCEKVLVGRQKKYCSNNCQIEFQYNKYIERWKNGEEDGSRGEYSISMYIKNYMLKKYDYKCARCGWCEINPYTNTLPLEVEHIDGDYQNNDENNLIILCPNCHSLTSTYKGANKGCGRKERKKYN